MSIAQRILANPGKFSIEQLKDAMEMGALPSYIAVPLIQEKVKAKQQAKMAETAAGAPGANDPTVFQEVMAQAAPAAGVTALPSGLPAQMAGGGIVAFEEGGEVERYQNQGLVAPSIYDTERDPLLRRLREASTEAPMTEEERKAQIRRDRASMMLPYAATADVLAAAPYNYLASRGSDLANLVGIPRLGRALGIYDPSVTSVQIPQIGGGGDRPFRSMLEQYASAPSTPTAAKTEPKKEEAAAPVAPPAPPAAPRDNAGIYSLMPTKGQFLAPPRMQSMEDATRRQLFGTDTEPGFLARSEARTRNLFAELGKNRLEGKAFEGLEASLKKEAEEAGADRTQAKNLAILKAGLATIAGTSRHALENLGRGALTGFEDYSAAVKDLKKAEKERQRQFAFIEQARRAEDQENFKRRDALLEKANAAAEANDKYGTSAIMNAIGVDQERGMKIWETQFGGERAVQVAQIGAGATLGAAQLRNAALANRGMDISSYQMARLRGDAEKVVDMDAVRAEMAKSLKLANPPKPGADKSFDAKVDALYNTKLNEVVARRLGMLPNAAGVNPNIYAGYSIVRDEG